MQPSVLTSECKLEDF
jgi:SWI/SNF-related matrix-associated actin-dependent regulator of chromatin subfamily A member 5